MSYNSEDYFLSNEFKTTLKQFEGDDSDAKYAMLAPDELVDIAEYYYNNGDVRKADKVIERTLCVYPGSASPLLFKARIKLIDNYDIKGAEYYTEQIEDKSDLDYFYMKAEIMLAKDNPEEADRYLEDKFGTVDDSDRDYFAIDAAELFLDYDYIDIADKWLGYCEDTESVDYKEQKSRILIGNGEYEKSKNLLNELIDENPYSTKYWNTLASSQLFNNNIEESIQSSEFAIAINPNNSAAILNKANGLYNLGNYKEALKYYQRYCELCPNDDNGEMFTGFCNILLEDYEEAIKHFRKAEKLSKPGSYKLLDIYRDWAFALCCLGRMDECMEVLDKTDALECDHNEMLVYRGNLLLGSGNWSEAKKCFLKAIKDSNYSPNIFMKIAITVFENGNSALAYKMFHTLYDNFKDWKAGYAHFTACCYDLGKTDEFLNNLKKAALYSPDELKMLLGKLFPEDMEPQNYYKYMSKIIGNTRKGNN